MNYDTNKARFTGRSCVAGNVAVRMLPTLPVYPSLARSRNALLSGAARNAASGRGRVMSACNNGCALRAAGAPCCPCSLRSRGNVACRQGAGRAAPWRQLTARSQRGIAAGLDGIWYVLAGTPDSEGGWDRSGVTGTTAVVQLIPSCNNFDSNSARNRIASINSRAGEDRVGRRREETTPSVVQGQLLAPVRITVLTTTRSL